MKKYLSQGKNTLQTSMASSYVRAVATLSTGQFFAAAIPILAAPILGRLYLPTHYGVLATYMALANVLGAMSTLQYAQAVISEKNDKRANDLVYICFLGAGLMSLIALAISLSISVLVGKDSVFYDVRGWMFFLPITTLAAGVTIAISTLANRHQQYGFMAKIQVIVVAITVSISITLGWLGYGAHGLFIAYFTGQLVTVVIYLRLYRKITPTFVKFRKTKLTALAYRHRNFPIYTLPSEFLGTISLQLPIFALSVVGAGALLGAFTRARQLVSMPLSLVGSSIAQVFRQKASKDYHEYGTCRPIFQKTFWVLAAIGIPPTLVLMAIAPDLFRIFLGPNWGQAGEIARILAPMLLLRLICSPLSTVMFFTGAQRLEFFMGLMRFSFIFIGVTTPIILNFPPLWSVFGFAISYIFIYIIYIILNWKLSRK